MNKIIFLLLLTLFSSFDLNHKSSSLKEFYYIEKTGSHTKSSSSTLKENDNVIYVTKKDPKGSYKLQYDKDYNLQEISFTSNEKKSSYHFVLQDRTLVCTGIENNKKKSASFDLKYSKWIQDFNFGFKPFVNSRNNQMDFVLVNPNDFSLVNMVVSKGPIDNLNIDGKTFDARKLKITLTGFFKSMFWKAQLWYDIKTNVLVKYKANEGPDTPTTKVTIKSIKG